MPLRTNKKEEIIDISTMIAKVIEKSEMENGSVFIHIPHTTAGITINENADDDVKKDILLGLKIFDRKDYRHMEGNSAAHIKSSLMGANLVVKVENNKLCLGTWQGIMFCEFDGPRNREIWIEIR